ncbi:NnrS family protein [Aliiroseovarius sp. YM-037]|uniref:NnrS family protein n=1 Tax=Aliiroseovarius sp. YM-037 TaxID=3341728 RepID=UPI003A8111AB
MAPSNRADYRGPALFSYGFRPFFLSAGVFALIVIPLWLVIHSGHLTLGGPFAPLDWHIHEMIYGYSAAVICGFLFTAIPNWTGRLPTRGWPLILLLTLWLAGRLAVAGVGDLPHWAAAGIDAAFLIAVVAMALVEIIAGKNWRNLKVVVPVLILLLSNILFHVEVMVAGASDIGQRLGIAVVVFLITLIGGRIIPSFTRNWLNKRGAAALPTPFNRFDAICIGAGGITLLLWASGMQNAVTSTVLLIAGILHAARLTRWQGHQTWRSPILLMLHVAYGFIPLGLIALAVAAPVVGLHLLGVGAIGGMTLAVMMRATMGHTGRDLTAGGLLTAAFALLITAALIRSLAGTITIAGLSGITLSATLWAIAFGVFVFRVGPWLLTSRVARRQPNRA